MIGVAVSLFLILIIYISPKMVVYSNPKIPPQNVFIPKGQKYASYEDGGTGGFDRVADEFRNDTGG
jgi:hypothetical protein